MTKCGHESRGFSWKIWKKKWDENRVFDTDVFFTKNIGMCAVCFLENVRFFTGYGHESSNFVVKMRKKKRHKIRAGCFWQLDAFSTKYRHTRSGFFMKMRKIKELELCIFEIGRFSDKIWAWEQQLFEKSGKIGIIPVCFLQSLVFFSGTRAGYFWQSGRFFDKIWAWELWFFHEKSENKVMGSFW